MKNRIIACAILLLLVLCFAGCESDSNGRFITERDPNEKFNINFNHCDRAIIIDGKDNQEIYVERFSSGSTFTKIYAKDGKCYAIPNSRVILIDDEA